MFLSSQKKNYNKPTTPQVLSQLMGDGWGAGAGVHAAARGAGRGARAQKHAGGAGRGARARENEGCAGRGARARAGGAGRGWGRAGRTRVGQGGAGEREGTFRHCPTVRVPPPHPRRQPPSASDHHPDAPSICPCAAHSAWGVWVVEDIGVPPCPAHAD